VNGSADGTAICAKIKDAVAEYGNHPVLVLAEANSGALRAVLIHTSTHWKPSP
jgi:hypothetical protein